jgi:hypothetical protein
MTPLVENIAVGVIVAVAALWAGRAIWRSRGQKSGCSSCSESGKCPAAGAGPQQLQTLDSQDFSCPTGGSSRPISS